MTKKKIIISVFLLIGLLCFVYIISTSGLIRLQAIDSSGDSYRSKRLPEIIAQNISCELDGTDADSARKAEFFRFLESAKGIYILKRERGTIEGDPVVIFLVAENGKVSFICDCTKDRYSFRGYLVEKSIEVKPGFKNTEGEFEEIATPLSVPAEKKLIIKVIRPNKKTIYF